jgi:hypothetical protein
MWGYWDFSATNERKIIEPMGCLDGQGIWRKYWILDFQQQKTGWCQVSAPYDYNFWRHEPLQLDGGVDSCARPRWSSISSSTSLAGWHQKGQCAAFSPLSHQNLPAKDRIKPRCVTLVEKLRGFRFCDALLPGCYQFNCLCPHRSAAVNYAGVCFKTLYLES